MDNFIEALQQTFAQDIPITKHIGITIEQYNREGLVLKAPLAGNTNPSGTAFAGSINSLTTLTGWGMLWLLLKELNLNGYGVIQQSQTAYLHPVTTDFSALCRRPEEDDINKFSQILQKRGKARLEVSVEVRQGDEVAVEFTGRYVVRLANNEKIPIQ